MLIEWTEIYSMNKCVNHQQPIPHYEIEAVIYFSGSPHIFARARTTVLFIMILIGNYWNGFFIQNQNQLTRIFFDLKFGTRVIWLDRKYTCHTLIEWKEWKNFILENEHIASRIWFSGREMIHVKRLNSTVLWRNSLYFGAPEYFISYNCSQSSYEIAINLVS